VSANATHSHDHHSHGAGAHLEPDAALILKNGVEKLIALSEGLQFRPLASERYPNPLAVAVYGETPDPARVREDALKHLEGDPVSSLEPALVLLELYESNQTGASDFLPDDGTFLGLVFGSKRLNGWAGALGDTDAEQAVEGLNEQWKFKPVPGRTRESSVYPLLNMLVRYGFVYGRIPPGDSHDLGHFIEDFTPGLLLCSQEMSDLDLTLSLAAMKLGVPAIVPMDYPFPLGRHVRVADLSEAPNVIHTFPNIRRLLDFPDIPQLPDYVSPQTAREEFEVAAQWGDTPESFYILRKGAVLETGVSVDGSPSGPMGVVLTVDAEPLDALDRKHIEGQAPQALSMVPGASAKVEDGRLVIALSDQTELTPDRVGETLIAAIRHNFPKIDRIRAEIIFDQEKLATLSDEVELERETRAEEILSTTEEDVDDFVTCVGCSPFAPDHVCVVTPERPPQCGRSYEMLKAGARYGLDDMSNIHHRAQHSGMNSFTLSPKRESIDAGTGEWAGINEAMWRLTGGRTKRVQLHALGDAPHTGCGCFKLIMFTTDKPGTGVAIMERGYKNAAPDGRTWADLHYALGGKQAPGIAGASPAYLHSAKFLSAHNGWDSVVWVSPGIAAMMGDRLPTGIQIGPSDE
jgi:acetyl-CoA decarbonylase/synthase, CODH/ACS complex subunit beta